MCQVRIATIIKSIERCRNAQDDIIIWADTPELFEKRTTEFLQAVRRSGLKRNRAKCQFNQGQLIFLGHTISNERIAPDAKRIETITDMSEPKNQNEQLQRFLGMITYLGKFLANLSTKTAPLRVLEKDTIWSFNKPQRDTFQDLKKMITQSPILKYFDPKLPIKTLSDASAQGLGALLEQLHENEWHPIAFAS